MVGYLIFIYARGFKDNILRLLTLQRFSLLDVSPKQNLAFCVNILQQKKKVLLTSFDRNVVVKMRCLFKKKKKEPNMVKLTVFLSIDFF